MLLLALWKFATAKKIFPLILARGAYDLLFVTPSALLFDAKEPFLFYSFIFLLGFYNTIYLLTRASITRRSDFTTFEAIIHRSEFTKQYQQFLVRSRSSKILSWFGFTRLIFDVQMSRLSLFYGYPLVYFTLFISFILFMFTLYIYSIQVAA